jgi:hypothetical protein
LEKLFRDGKTDEADVLRWMKKRRRKKIDEAVEVGSASLSLNQVESERQENSGDHLAF